MQNRLPLMLGMCLLSLLFTWVDVQFRPKDTGQQTETIQQVSSIEHTHQMKQLARVQQVSDVPWPGADASSHLQNSPTKSAGEHSPAHEAPSATLSYLTLAFCGLLFIVALYVPKY
jgi:hypothetical protein